MCSKCEEFDEKIAHYRRMAGYITDELTLMGIKDLITKAADEKTALHPEERR